jgi:hypothetical protein
MPINTSLQRAGGSGSLSKWSRVALLPVALLSLGLVHVPAAWAATPSLAISDATVTERSITGLTANVRVQLSQRPTRLVTVHFATVDGTAKAPGDYAARAGTVKFRIGDRRTKTIAIPIAGDRLDEGEETFRVRLSDPVNGRISDGTGIVTIVDDDPMPRASVADVAADEGDAGATTLRFKVALSAPSGRLATIGYAVTPGTATLNGDYTVDPASGLLRFPAGTVNRYVTLSIIGDTVDETPETVNLALVAPTNVVLTAVAATATIRDDDGPGLRVSDASLTDEGAGLSFTVSLAAASPETVSVHYATQSGTATAPGDYVSKSGVLTFTPGQTSQAVVVSSVNDTVDEVDEYFYVRLTEPVNAPVADEWGSGYINDNDGPGVRVIDPAAIVEGSVGYVTVSLTAASVQAVSVNYATASGSAASGSDYWAASGALTFTPGQTSKTVAVSTVNDTVTEDDEYLYMDLASPVDGYLADSWAYVYIDSNSSTTKSLYLGSVRGDDGADQLSRVSQVFPTGDVDFYRFVLVESESGIFDDDLSGRIQLEVAEGGGNLDLYVYNSAGSLVGQSTLEGTLDETVNVSREDTNGDDSSSYYARVVGYGGTTNSYTLRVRGNT